jgi:hypothetical protein
VAAKSATTFCPSLEMRNGFGREAAAAISSGSTSALRELAFDVEPVRLDDLRVAQRERGGIAAADAVKALDAEDVSGLVRRNGAGRADYAVVLARERPAEVLAAAAVVGVRRLAQ